MKDKESDTWTHRFEYRGYTYTLIKRDQTRNGIWWVRFIHNGQKIRRACGSSVASVAEKYAKTEVIEPALAGKLEKKGKKVEPMKDTTLGDVFGVYRQLSVGKIEPRTVEDNLNGLRLIVRRSFGKDSMTNEDVECLPVTVLTGKMVADFEDNQARRAIAQGLNLESNKRTVASYLRHARSLFKETSMPRYAELGLVMPDLDGFMTRKVERPAKLKRPKPSDALLRKTFEQAEILYGKDRPAYIAWLMGLVSMRRGEISLMKWEWAQMLNGRAAIVIPVEVTKSGAERVIPVDARVLEELQKFREKERSKGVDKDEESFVLPSPRVGQGAGGLDGVRLRAQNVFKRANTFMRGCGWETNHTIHELRALYLSWIRDRHGLDAAQSVAGHSDRRTTQDHYVGMADVPEAIPLPVQFGR